MLYSEKCVDLIDRYGMYVFTNSYGYVTLIVNTSRSFRHSWLITPRLTRRVPIVDEELLTLPEHLMSPLVFSGVLVTRSLVLCVCFVDRCLSFCPFLLFAIVLYVVLFRFTDIDYPFGIFKLFLTYEINCIIFNMFVIIKCSKRFLKV